MTRRDWAVLLAAAICALLTTRMGVWQLDRAAQKSGVQSRMVQRAAMTPLAPPELARDATAADGQLHRRITLRGRWLSRATVYLDNRQMNGRPGFFVVTPLLLSPDDAVLVQRGWMPRDFVDRTRLQPLPDADGELSVTGRIAMPPSKLFEWQGGSAGPIRQNLDLAEFSREIGLQLRPLSIQQLEGPELTNGLTSSRAPDGLQRQWLVPAADVAKHHGYAFQWFALSALSVGLYAWFQIIRPRRAAAQ